MGSTRDPRNSPRCAKLARNHRPPDARRLCPDGDHRHQGAKNWATPTLGAMLALAVRHDAAAVRGDVRPVAGRTEAALRPAALLHPDQAQPEILRCGASATGPIRADLLGNMWAGMVQYLRTWWRPRVSATSLQPDRPAGRQEIRSGQNGAGGGGLLLLARHGAAARDLLHPLATGAAARPRRDLPCFGVERRLKGRSADQDVHQAERRRFRHYPPRARAQLLPARLQPAPYLYQDSANDGSTSDRGFCRALGNPGISVQIGLLDRSKCRRRTRTSGCCCAGDGQAPSCRSAMSSTMALGGVFRRIDHTRPITIRRVDLKRKIRALCRRWSAPKPTSTPVPNSTSPHNHVRALFPRPRAAVPILSGGVRLAGLDGPLHRCSLHGNKDVGQRLTANLATGLSKPWPDALEAFNPARARSRASPCSTISRRCKPGSSSRTAASNAVGDRA